MIPLGHQFPSQTAVDQVSWFCIADDSGPGHVPKTAPSPEGSGLPPNTWFLGPSKSTTKLVSQSTHKWTHMHAHTHTRLTALCLGLPRWAGTRKVKPIWILLKQETVSGSGISWAICKPAPRSRQLTTQAPHHSVFYRPDALPAAQPTASKHWRQKHESTQMDILITIFCLPTGVE